MLLPENLALRPVGFYEELGPVAHYAGKMREALQDKAAPDEQKVVNYLNGGYIMLDVPETATDVIAGKERIIGAPSLMSDGTWVWRLDLAYYVANYHLRLPAEFLDHLYRRQFLVPSLSALELERVGQDALRFF